VRCHQRGAKQSSHLFYALYLQPGQAPPTPSSTSPLPQYEEEDLEEQQLRQKLLKMTDNIGDHDLTSDEDEAGGPLSSQEIPVWRSPEGEATPTRIPTRIPTRPTSRTSIVLCRLEEERPETRKVRTGSMSKTPETYALKHLNCRPCWWRKRARLMKFKPTSAGIHLQLTRVMNQVASSFSENRK